MLRFYINNQSVGTALVTEDTKLVEIASYFKTLIDESSNIENAFVCSFNFFEVPWCGTPELAYMQNECVPHPVEVIVPGDLNDPKLARFTLKMAKQFSREEYQASKINHLEELKEIRVDLLRARGLTRYEYISDPAVFESLLIKHANAILFDFIK